MTLFYVWLLFAVPVFLRIVYVIGVEPLIRMRKIYKGTTWAHEREVKQKVSPWDKNKKPTAYEITDICGSWVRYREVNGTYQWSEKKYFFCMKYMPYDTGEI